jgi:hypothetical protein
MIEIQAPKAFDETNKSVNNLISVTKIITKDEQEKQKSDKVTRSRRPSTRPDLAKLKSNN